MTPPEKSQPSATPKDDPRQLEPTLQDQWDAEAERSIDESALRGTPEWLEAIGPEDQPVREIEQHLQDDGWGMRGEDDFVSDPTGEADMPGWVDDDYDDEIVDELDDEEAELESGDDKFYR